MNDGILREWKARRASEAIGDDTVRRILDRIRSESRGSSGGAGQGAPAPAAVELGTPTPRRPAVAVPDRSRALLAAASLALLAAGLVRFSLLFLLFLE